MSLNIVRAGILDSIQDRGRSGYQQLGVNPSGCMDQFAADVVNILVGNDRTEAVIEMHFPAATILFRKDALIAIGGGNFSPTINGQEISMWQPVIASKNSVLQFQKWESGARCYLAIKEKLEIPKWLNSYSTNLKAAAGGYHGHALQKGDMILLSENYDYKNHLGEKDHFSLPWKADVNWGDPGNKISVSKGNEWDWLSADAQEDFVHQNFIISASADRMGYQLEGKLTASRTDELISSAVGFGTVQLLPNGELIVLMADHQTTGGYPRIAHVASAHLSRLAQMRPGEKIRFQIVTAAESEASLIKQNLHLLQLQNACTFRLKQFLHA